MGWVTRARTLITSPLEILEGRRILTLPISAPTSAILILRLFDYLVRPIQQLWRNRNSDLLCRLYVDNKLEFCGLLHGQVSRRGAFQNPVHIVGSAPVQIGKSRRV